MRYNLLSEKQHKADKAIVEGRLQGILQLQPDYPISDIEKARLERHGFKFGCTSKCTTCPYSGLCRRSCLADCGFNSSVMNKHAKSARVRRTRLLLQHTDEFLELLRQDLRTLETTAAKLGLKPAARLNGTSDLWWPEWLMIAFSGIEFLDYTKDTQKALQASTGQWPSNYHLTYSWNENSAVPSAAGPISNWLYDGGVNIAVIFAGDLPAEYTIGGITRPVIDGDTHDLRYLDKSGAIVGLRFKHPLKAGGWKKPRGFGRLVIGG